MLPLPLSGVSSLFGTEGQYGEVDGQGATVRLRPADGMAGDGDARVLQQPRGVVATSDAYIVADTGNHRIVRIAKR